MGDLACLLSPLFGDVLGLGGGYREYSMDLISRSLPTLDDWLPILDGWILGREIFYLGNLSLGSVPLTVLGTCRMTSWIAMFREAQIVEHWHPGKASRPQQVIPVNTVILVKHICYYHFCCSFATDVAYISFQSYYSVMILASQETLNIENVASGDLKNCFLRESAQCLHSFKNTENQRRPRLIRIGNVNLSTYACIFSWHRIWKLVVCITLHFYFNMHLLRIIAHRQRKADFCESEDNLVYIVSFRPSRAT